MPAGPSLTAKPARPAGAQGERVPAARQPSSRAPGPARRRPQTRPQEDARRPAAPGDIACARCGQGNEAGRRFCHECGTSLAQAEPAPAGAPPPWWKRRARRSSRTYAAGERRTRADGTRRDGTPRGVAGLRKVVRVVGAIACVLLLLALAGPWRSGFRNRVGDVGAAAKNIFVASYEPVHPDGAEASTAIPDRPATNAIDGATNTAWQEAHAGDGENEVLVLTFSSQVDIDRLGIYSGVSENPDEFLAQPRPRELRVAFSDGTSTEIRLKDTPGFQSFTVKARAVVSVQITILSVYPSFRGGHDAGIAEVELFTRA